MIEILNRYTTAVLYKSTSAPDIKSAMVEAVRTGANLWGANLRGADLRGANLRGADLREADLREADLWEADLRGANLREADLREADLWEAGALVIQGHPWHVCISGHGKWLRVGCDSMTVANWRKRTHESIGKKHGKTEADWWTRFGPSILAMCEAMEEP